jgi:hypothetical protein
MQEELALKVGNYEVIYNSGWLIRTSANGVEWTDGAEDTRLILALAQEVRRLQKALSDSAMDYLTMETQAEEAYRKQLAAEKRVQELTEEILKREAEDAR